VPAALRGRDRVGELGLGDLRPQGGTPEEDLHARAAPRHRGARPPAPHRVADRGGLAPQHLPVERRDVTGMMDQGNRWRGVFNDYSNPSFMDLLRREAPHLMPSASPVPQEVPHEPPHGTTVLSMRYRDGVIMAGDRQATAGFQVASRRIEKIFKADEQGGVGRLFKYDITGGRYEETNYDAQGSGANYARDSLKKLWKRDMARDDALRVALEALFDAADEDVGTGGADLVRGIFPTVK